MSLGCCCFMGVFLRLGTGRMEGGGPSEVGAGLRLMMDIGWEGHRASG